jgi:hypothetical protein
VGDETESNKDAGKTDENGEGDPWPAVPREIEGNGEKLEDGLPSSRSCPCPALANGGLATSPPSSLRVAKVGANLGIARLSVSVSLSLLTFFPLLVLGA